MKWYDIKASAQKPDEAEVFVYGDIGQDWWGESVAAVDFVREISALDVGTLNVRLNSYGGSITDGVAIYNALKRHRATVNISIDGAAHSIASLIAMAGDNVSIAANAMMMIHAPWAGNVGNATSMREFADVLDKHAQAMATSYAAKTGKPVDEMLALLTDNAEHWYSADEAVAAGFADEVTESIKIAASFNSRFIKFDGPKQAQSKPAAAAAAQHRKEIDMPEANHQAATVDPVAIANEINARNKALLDTGKAYAKFGGESLAMEAVAGGWTQDQLNAKLLAAASSGGAHATYGAGARVDCNIDAKTHGFSAFGEFAHHVRAAALGVGRLDQRLQAAATTFGNTESGPDGGFAIPPQFAQAITSLALEEQSLLSMCDNMPVSGNSMSFPRDETTAWGTTGIYATWDGEGDAASQRKTVVGLDTLRLKKLRVLVPASDELLADSVAMSAHLTRKMSEAVLWKTNDAIINGTGAGQPLGILTAASLVAQAKETSQVADTIVAANVAKMYGRCMKGVGANLVWLMNPDALQQIITMIMGDQPIWTAPVQGMRNAPDGLLMGRPIILTDACDTVGDQGDIILANMAGYRAITKAGGEEFTQSMHLWFDQDMAAFKLVFRMDGQPALSASVTPPNSAVTRSHFVALAARA